jgi:alkylhydroperoxidase/carboxymuconolactone decarboxylase family protein YurZ
MSDEPIPQGLAGGPARRRRAQGAKSDQLMAAMSQLDPQLVDWANGFIFGELWAREGLTHDERLLVAITALGAGGNVDQLRTYAWGALQAGIPASKIHEALVMLVVYKGFPHTLTVLATWREVVEGARKAGIDVDIAPPAGPDSGA